MTTHDHGSFALTTSQVARSRSSHIRAMAAWSRSDNPKFHIAAEQAAVNHGVSIATASASHQERFLLGGSHYGLSVLQAEVDPRSHAFPAFVAHYEQFGMFDAAGFAVEAGDVFNVLWPFD